MLRHFEHQTVAAVLGLDRVQNGGQMSLELHVDDGADDLRDASGLVGLCGHKLSPSNSYLETVSLIVPVAVTSPRRRR